MEILFKYIKEKTNELKNIPQTFRGIFNVIHNQNDRIFAEYIDAFTIKSVSYNEMKEYCYKMANYLKPLINQPKNSFVGFYMENSINWVATLWALLMLGYRPLLLNCKLPNDVNNQILKTMKVSTIVTVGQFKNRLKAETIVLPDDEIIQNQELLEIEDWADEIALCTTASSLNYKICVYSGQNMFNQLMNARDIIKQCPQIKKHFNHRLKHLTFLPFYHIFGLVATYLWFSCYGRTMVFLSDYSADTIMYTIRRCEVTHIFAIPLFWNAVASEINKQVNRQPEKTQKKFVKGQKLSLAIQNIWPWLGTKLARKLFRQIIINSLGQSIKFIVTGGGYISDSTLYLLNSIGYPLANGYGSTEAGIVCVEERKKPKWRIIGSVGKPLESVDVKIENNHLFIKGLSTCSYLINKDGTKINLSETWYDTLDIATIDKNNFLYIQGRSDDVIVSTTGEKINPDLIEKKLRLVNVNKFVVVSIKGKTSLVLQIPRNSNIYLITSILEQIKENFSKLQQEGYLIESVYFTYDQISPENSIKVSRKIFNKLLNEGKIQLHDYQSLKQLTNKTENETVNDVTYIIKKIFADVLNKDPKSIGNNQHFFLDLGGTSLDYCTCFVRIQDEFNIKIESEQNQCKTVDEFSDYIIQHKGK